MKRKILMIFMAIVATICCALGLAACGDTDDDGADDSENEDVIPPPHDPSEGLEFVLIDEETGYAVCGKDTCTDADFVIPSTHEGLPVVRVDNKNGIADDASSAYPDITSVYIPNSVTEIGIGAFALCESLTSITIPNSVTEIGGSVFTSCLALTSITIPDSVTSIGKDAFGICTSLKSITIPDSVNSIGDRTFQGCTSLKSIILPNGITSIGAWAFDGCTSLSSIEFKGTKEQWDNIQLGNFWNYSAGDYTVQCTDGKLNKDGAEIE